MEKTVKKHIRALLETSPPERYTDNQISKIPESHSYVVATYCEGSREGERPFFDFEGCENGLCKVRINGYTFIKNEDFVEIQRYVRSLQEGADILA